MKFTIGLPKILCLILLLYKHVKNIKYYNTNDLVLLANELKPKLVRLRKDKNDYKFLDDTNWGGLRGNFSTLLTFKGISKKNNRFTPNYSLSQADRLLNAVQKGEIIINTEDLCAYTCNSNLKKILEEEKLLYKIREEQAHIKKFLENNKDFPLQRDYKNFPKVAVLKTPDDVYFMRILFNRFNKNIIEFNMFSYLSNSAIKVSNIHPLFIIPSEKNSWEEFLVIDNKEILLNPQLFIFYDKEKQEFCDKEGNKYKHYSLKKGIEVLSDQNGNADERLSYNWKKIRENMINDTVIIPTNVMQSEFSVFLENFLKWNAQFSILNKKVVDVKESSSGGADVILTFSGGTKQKLELEHKWNNYIAHEHYKNKAWKGCWLYANESWDFNKIKKIFAPYTSQYMECIPQIFLCTNPTTKNKEAYQVDWNDLSYKELDIN